MTSNSDRSESSMIGPDSVQGDIIVFAFVCNWKGVHTVFGCPWLLEINVTICMHVQRIVQQECC